MRKALFTFCSLILLLLVYAPSKADGIEFQHDKTFQQLLDMAKAQNKIIFMDCYTAWCGPCKRLAAQVFPDSSVGQYFNANFINAKFDMEKEEGPSIAARYGIRAYPTLLWIDGAGNVVHKLVGGTDVVGLIAQGKKAIDPTPGLINGMRKQYNDGNRDVNFLSDFISSLQNTGDNYEPFFKEYLDKLTNKDLSDPKHARTVFNLTNNIKSPGVPYLTKNRESYIQLLGAEVYNAKINTLAEKAAAEAPKANDAAMFTAAVELVKNNKAADAAEKQLTMSMTYYSKMNDWVNYDKNASAYIKKYAPKKASVLNDVAWTYYLNINDRAQLQKAAKWAFEAINTDNKYTYNLTYAYLLYKLEELKEAQKACDYAIIRAKEENANPSSASFLKEAISKTLEKQP